MSDQRGPRGRRTLRKTPQPPQKRKMLFSWWCFSGNVMVPTSKIRESASVPFLYLVLLCTTGRLRQEQLDGPSFRRERQHERCGVFWRLGVRTSLATDPQYGQIPQQGRRNAAAELVFECSSSNSAITKLRLFVLASW